MIIKLNLLTKNLKLIKGTKPIKLLKRQFRISKAV